MLKFLIEIDRERFELNLYDDMKYSTSDHWLSMNNHSDCSWALTPRAPNRNSKTDTASLRIQTNALVINFVQLMYLQTNDYEFTNSVFTNAQSSS